MTTRQRTPLARLGMWLSITAVWVSATLGFLWMNDWAAIHYPFTERATVVSVSDCVESPGGLAYGPSHCEVSWRAEDGETGTVRVDAGRDRLADGSTIHVAGDQGYTSRWHLNLAAVLGMLPNLVLVVMLAIYALGRLRKTRPRPGVSKLTITSPPPAPDVPGD
ncbi:hypothetical protein [Streptomyces sp. NPDC127098]|uniref:hypothetical protein n=1 Tax=Streptomyces sp. NPDC127098 TaxID=3347137 RepID=UPI00366557BB